MNEDVSIRREPFVAPPNHAGVGGYETTNEMADRAVADLEQVQRSLAEAQDGGVSGGRSLLDCLHQIITAPRRRDAVDALARRVAFECPATVVRIAIGRRRIDQFFDSRLGWLPRGNSVRDEASETFDSALRDRDLSRRFLIAAADSSRVSTPSKRAEQSTRAEHPSETPTVAGDSYHCIDLSPPRGDRDGNDSGGITCLLLMRGQAGEEAFAGPPAWLRDGAGVLATALASRPKVTLPRWVDFVGSRPAATLMLTLMITAGFGLWPVNYPVRCNAVIAPTHSRVVATPFDARLQSIAVVPGDAVKKGQTLLQLDGRPLRIELDAIESEIRAAEKDANIALATGKIAEAQRANLQRNKLMHRSELLRSRLNQLSVISPTDGIVIGSDLRRHVGSPLSVGDTLMEIAPIDRVAVEIEVPEFEVNLVGRGDDTRIRFDAVGGRSTVAEIEQIDPGSEIRDDENVYIARMTIENRDGKYRPGMNGDATVFGPVRPLAWAHVRPWWERFLWAIGY